MPVPFAIILVSSPKSATLVIATEAEMEATAAALDIVDAEYIAYSLAPFGKHDGSTDVPALALAIATKSPKAAPKATLAEAAATVAPKPTPNPRSGDTSEPRVSGNPEAADKIVLNYLEKYGSNGASTSAIAEAKGWSPAFARATLSRMEEEGKIRRVGNTRATRWFIVKEEKKASKPKK